MKPDPPIPLAWARVMCAAVRSENSPDSVVGWTCRSCDRALKRGETPAYASADGNRGCAFILARIARLRSVVPERRAPL